jgi:type I restriction-modification system DNA methylase subunit
MKMDTKKEQERDELHRAIWAIADDLRGSVDGWDFKSYVLGFMFYRYISENLTNYINKGEYAAGNTDFDYIALPDTVRFICEANGYDAEKIGQHFLEILPKITEHEEGLPL